MSPRPGRSHCPEAAALQPAGPHRSVQPGADPMSALTFHGRRWRAWAGSGLVALAALVGAVGPASAVLVTGPGGTADQGRRLVVAAPAVAVEQATLALIDGRIEAVDGAGRWLQLQGRQVGLHPDLLRLLGPGGPLPGGVRGLRPGQDIRFALEPDPAAGPPTLAAAAAAPRRIVLILLEARP